MARNCKTCSNARFDSTWGDYKCLVHQHKIYDPAILTDEDIKCDRYEAGTPEESKRDYQSN